MDVKKVRFNPHISAAIRGRNLQAFKALLEAEPEQIHAFTPFAGGTWLHFAAWEGDLDAVLHLLASGLDVNVGDAREGRTPLCDASSGGHEAVVRALLDAGARLDTSDPVRNALFAAIVGRSIPVATLLLEAGIDPEVRYGGSMKGMNAIGFAFERGETEIARLIANRVAGDDEAAAQGLIDEGLNMAATANLSREAP